MGLSIVDIHSEIDLRFPSSGLQPLCNHSETLRSHVVVPPQPALGMSAPHYQAILMPGAFQADRCMKAQPFCRARAKGSVSLMRRTKSSKYSQQDKFISCLF